MRTLDDIYGRCVPDEVTGCMKWHGCSDKYGPRVYAPDMRFGGAMKTQYGRRVVWQLQNGRPLPSGWQVFGTCEEHTCLSYEHMQAGTPKMRGRRVRANGSQKGLLTRTLANRKINQAKTNVTPELIMEIRSSEETGLALSARLGINRNTISRIRRHQFTSVQSAGIFSGLIR